MAATAIETSAEALADAGAGEIVARTADAAREMLGTDLAYVADVQFCPTTVPAVIAAIAARAACPATP
jgi:hypothetical protein